MKQNVELMSLFWTTAGIHPDDTGISRFDFRDRVEAAAKAGFKGIGIWREDLAHILESRTLKEMKAILDDNGMKYVELEFLTDWFVEGERKKESDIIRDQLFRASEALNAKHVKVGDFNSTRRPMGRIVESFAALCSEAEKYGATIAFEFMPSSMLNNLKDSAAMVEQAGAKNGGLALDFAHFSYFGNTFDELKQIPVQHLVSLELNDGFLPGRPGYVSGNRNYCGEGEFDVKGFIKCGLEMGYTKPWAVEVINREFSSKSLEELSRRAFDTTISQFL